MKFNFLNGENGDPSSKRLFTFILVLLWVVYFFANLFWGKVLKDTLEANLFYMICVFFTGVTTEKLINNISKKDPPKDTP